MLAARDWVALADVRGVAEDTEDCLAVRVVVVGFGGGPMDVRCGPVMDVRLLAAPAAGIFVLEGVPVREAAVLDAPLWSLVGDFNGDLVGDCALAR